MNFLTSSVGDFMLSLIMLFFIVIMAVASIVFTVAIAPIVWIVGLVEKNEQ